MSKDIGTYLVNEELDEQLLLGEKEKESVEREKQKFQNFSEIQDLFCFKEKSGSFLSYSNFFSCKV